MIVLLFLALVMGSYGRGSGVGGGGGGTRVSVAVPPPPPHTYPADCHVDNTDTPKELTCRALGLPAVPIGLPPTLIKL
ncbi:uncharacterized protein [Bemisia tabaci]|uniref:uncharacterized protein n=1 Tax=Bemisia tabaci TaxID=7038 RepID=UPI003B284F5C